jgi:hypothetical protein
MTAPLPAYRVFAQRAPGELDLAACDAQARRFFAATLEAGPEGHVVITTVARGGGGPDAGADAKIAQARAIVGRAASDADRAMADEAEARAGGGGLAGLARRCAAVWEVERRGDDDTAALRIAALLASVMLGPIVDPIGPAIFGVKTARERLERAARTAT